MALGYQNPFYLKQAQKKQQSLYDGKILLEKHDPPIVHDLEETLQLAQESRDKMKQMNKKIKPANYTKINHLSGVFVPQTALSREELYFSNNSKMANVSKSFLIPNEDLSDDTTPSVARKFLNEEAAKFVGDFKSLGNESDASLAKHKALELEIERLLKAVVSQDIMIIVQNESVVDTSDLQTELERTKERFKKYIIKKETEYAKLWNDWINPSKTSREEKQVPNTVSASARTKPITVSQPPVITKKDVNSGLNGLSSTGIHNTKTRRPQPRSNTKNDRVPKNRNNVDRLILVNLDRVVQICLWCVDSDCSKHMNEKIKLLINFVWKFLGTIRFGNDHIAGILGYGDLKWGNITITRRNTCFIRDLDSVDLLKEDGSINLYTINLYDMASASPICLMARANPTKSWLWHQRLSHLNFDTGLPKMISSLVYQSLNMLENIFVPLEYFDSVGITHETSSAKTPQQNGVVERRNRTLVEASRTMLIFSHAPLFLWAEAIATAKPNISYLHVFGALCYPKNDREDIDKLEAPRTILAATVIQNLQASTASMSIQDSTPAPINSSNTLVSSHNVDAQSQQHAQQ
nr:hypothetical protein [Tanacetum cinerariifolium]